MPWTREKLATHLAAGATVDFLFFWGHTPKARDAVDRSCLSQWFPRSFAIEGVSYASAEHWMMASKARLFSDTVRLAQILEAGSPAAAKKLGREVTPFDATKWAAACFDLVVQGNVAKFSQHEDLKAFLLGTEELVLVEAAPRDVVWGIGLGAQNPLARQPSKWRGRNLLGFALMEARAQIRKAS
jgi:ribA/ribD-fused uncharacterized protein